MTKRKKNTSLFQKDLVNEALVQSFVKLNPRIMWRNPVMFTVEIGTVVMAIVCGAILFNHNTTQGSLGYNIAITLILFVTVLFANFAEALAEARGKAQANSLRKTREERPAKKIVPLGEMYVDEVQIVNSSELKKGDVFLCETGDIIPMDGEIIEGLATIDESAITGESAPVIRE
jgi:K+-transporting ATPase ATPase B chain